jgi:N-acetylglutamate synthase-like GNAT family acetyltransferase
MGDKKVDTAITIRRYRPEDLESCRVLWVELTKWHRHIYQSPDIGGSDPGRHFDEHLSRVSPEDIWVAEVGGQVVGLVGLILGENDAELDPLVVSTSYRGRGIGRQLAKAAIETARAAGVHQLTVRPVARNEQAIRFFHELGFDILGHIDLFMDFAPTDRQSWRSGERVAGKDFRL